MKFINNIQIGSENLFFKEGSFLNIGQSVLGSLAAKNFASAFMSALEYSANLYIPDGEYDLREMDIIKIENQKDKNIYIRCGANARFLLHDRKEGLFSFKDCKSVHFEGGTFIGDGRDKDYTVYNKHATDGGYGFNDGVIYFENVDKVLCEDMHFSGIQLTSCLSMVSCFNSLVQDCTIKCTMFYGIHFVDSCKYITVQNCTFDGIKLLRNHESENWYCYAVATGLTSLDMVGVEPPRSVRYIGNKVSNSEDSGLDTHGAMNVLIANNDVIDCNTALTVYNDTNRVTRPEDFKMRNIIIRNNHCKSKYVNNLNKHPFILVANSNKKSRDQFNYLIENNYFESDNNENDYGSWLIHIERISNCVVRNNAFQSKKCKYMLYSKYCENLKVFNSISPTDKTLIFVDEGTSCQIDNNEYFAQVKNKPSFVDCSDFGLNSKTMYKYHDIDSDGNIVSSYGICQKGSGMPTYNVKVEPDGVTITSEQTVPVFKGLCVMIGEQQCYVMNVYSDTKFDIYSNKKPNTGSQTMTIKQATSTAIVNRENVIVMDDTIASK